MSSHRAVSSSLCLWSVLVVSSLHATLIIPSRHCHRVKVVYWKRTVQSIGVLHSNVLIFHCIYKYMSFLYEPFLLSPVGWWMFICTAAILGPYFVRPKSLFPQLMPHDCHSPLTYVVFTVTAAAIYNLRLCHTVVETAPKVVRWTSNALPADLPAAIHSGVFCSLQKTAQNALLAYLLS